MALIQYLVRVKDQTGTKVCEFVGRGRRVSTPGGMEGFSYQKKVRASGAFTLQINADDDRVQYLDLDNAGTLDSIIEFWRKDVVDDLAYQNWLAGLPAYRKDATLPGWYRDFEGFLRDMEFVQGEGGVETFTARGQGLNGMLMAEPILYAAESAYTDKAGPVETVLKEFVNENIGPGATNPPRFRDGVMPGLTIQADGATGAVWIGARMGKNLLDVAQELAGYGGGLGQGDYMIVETGAVAFEFQWSAGQWGLDKTRLNGVRPPVVFSPSRHNATNLRYRYDRLNEVNTVDALGVGKAGDRVYANVASGTEADSPWNRRAVMREDTSQWVTAILEDDARQTLAAQRLKREMSFDMIQFPTRYGVNWEVGDLVTVQYRGREVNQKIVGVTIALGNDGAETIKPELEDYE
jgi:hypothetical protein